MNHGDKISVVPGALLFNLLSLVQNMSERYALQRTVIVLLAFLSVRSVYIPGVMPTSYIHGAPVSIKVNSLTSAVIATFRTLPPQGGSRER